MKLRNHLLAGIVATSLSLGFGGLSPVWAEGSPEEAFLEENAKRPGVIKRPSGLQIRIIRRGNGTYPDENATVSVHYEGRLVDGTVFDSSYKRGKPASFRVGDVIEGWQEALLLMQIGSEWELVIPADLAYGDDGAGKTVPPGATLIFKVELLEIAGR